MAFKGFRRGWFGESYRHYLAAKGVKSGGYFFPRPVKGGPQPAQLKAYGEKVAGALEAKRLAKALRQDEIAEAMLSKQESPVEREFRIASEQDLARIDVNGKKRYDELRRVEEALKLRLGEVRGGLQYEDLLQGADEEAKSRRREAGEESAVLMQLLGRVRMLEEGYLYGDPDAAELLSSGVTGGVLRDIAIEDEQGVRRPVVEELDPEVRAILENEMFDDSAARSYLDTVVGAAGKYNQESPDDVYGGLQKYHRTEVRKGKEMLLAGDKDRAVMEELQRIPSETRGDALRALQGWRSVREDEAAAIRAEYAIRQAYGQRLAQALQNRRKYGPGKDVLGNEAKEIQTGIEPHSGGYWRMQQGFRRKKSSRLAGGPPGTVYRGSGPLGGS